MGWSRVRESRNDPVHPGILSAEHVSETIGINVSFSELMNVHGNVNNINISQNLNCTRSSLLTF